MLLLLHSRAICGRPRDLGKNPLPRAEVLKFIWEFIKEHRLIQYRIVYPDAALRKVLKFQLSSNISFQCIAKHSRGALLSVPSARYVASNVF